MKKADFEFTTRDLELMLHVLSLNLRQLERDIAASHKHRNYEEAAQREHRQRSFWALYNKVSEYYEEVK